MSSSCMLPRAGTLPPADLRARVAGTDDGEWFHKSGLTSVDDITKALKAVGADLDSFQSVLDFGCGCGRIITPLLSVVAPGKVTGVDIDDEALAWVRVRHPEVRFRTVDPLPPLPFPDDTFDLVYCHSVFTHMNVDYQDQWLSELRRVTMPGAYLLLSFSGETPFRKLLNDWQSHGVDPAPMSIERDSNGTLFIADDGWKDGPFPDFYHSMFHTLDYVKHHWGQFFEVLLHLPEGSLGYQDFIVLKTPAKVVPSAGVTELAFPPVEFRRLVGPTAPELFDNPTGDNVFPEIVAGQYQSVFDFGCGCGRIARQLLQQRARPERYVGIDIHQGMLDWNRQNLSKVDPLFQFLFHDVHNLGLAPRNKKRDFAPFPVGDREFTLINAHSVFTHILAEPTLLYLSEITRILHGSGIARTTWFLFDKTSLPWLEESQNCLYVNDLDPTNAVIYDRHWLWKRLEERGLRIVHTVSPALPGHQWTLFLSKDPHKTPDPFILSTAAEHWLCGAMDSEVVRLREGLNSAHQEAKVLREQLTAVSQSWSWRITAPLRMLFARFPSTATFLSPHKPHQDGME
ncbi:MAG: class I SAM-dependent methyltransferase [Acidobacteria bacterium]|nr:class I SAM-dependent methyltransferase [Acidobacteriota bacterium]